MYYFTLNLLSKYGKKNYYISKIESKGHFKQNFKSNSLSMQMFYTTLKGTLKLNFYVFFVTTLEQYQTSWDFVLKFYMETFFNIYLANIFPCIANSFP